MNEKRIAVVYLMAVLLLSTAAIYFREGIDESSELGSSSISENQEGSGTKDSDAETAESAEGVTASEGEVSAEAANEMSAALTETVFFLVVGAAYVAVTIWLMARKNSKAPYIVAIVGSLALIILYVATRSVALPIVGLQDDVGSVDILSKVLQAGIVAAGLYTLRKGAIEVKREVPR